ncbi:unnamed protein product [Prunus brigantina]
MVRFLYAKENLQGIQKHHSRMILVYGKEVQLILVNLDVSI